MHEGPHAISKNNYVKFQKGMILSNEPGYYEKNKFGIRIENLIFVKKGKGKKFFDNLTMVPIDKDLIDLSLLNEAEIRWLNSYHQKVFKNLKYAMNSEEILDLKRLVQLSNILFHSFSIIILISNFLLDQFFFL